MPKLTDTAEKVFHAADKLLSEGKRPTQQSVREIIGTGSITTINHALNAWWQSLSGRLNRQSEHPALPEPVISAASKLWDQALAYSYASLEDERLALKKHLDNSTAQLDQKHSALQQDVFKLQAQNNRLLEQNEQLSQEKSALASEVNSLELKLIKSMANAQELERQNKQQTLMLEQADNLPLLSKNQEDDLFQAKISLKVNEQTIEALKKSLQQKEQECEQLQTQVFELEKNNIKQVHRLEMVIAQQDMKYSQLQGQLDEDDKFSA